MEGVNFKEAVITVRGDHLTDHYGQKVGNLRAYRDGVEVITKWRMSWRERLSALFFGAVWLRFLGQTIPPVALVAERNIFRRS